jgi:hypothetical protein
MVVRWHKVRSVSSKGKIPRKTLSTRDSAHQRVSQGEKGKGAGTLTSNSGNSLKVGSDLSISKPLQLQEREEIWSMHERTSETNRNSTLVTLVEGGGGAL